MAFPLQFRNSASTKLSAVPLTRNSSIFFPYTIIDSRPFLFQLRSHQVPAFAKCTLCFFAILLSCYGCIFFPFLITPNGMDAPDQQRTDSSDFPSAYGIFRYDRQSSSPRCLSHQKSTCSIYIIFLLFSPVQKEASGSRSPLSVRSPLILFPYRLKICTTSKESLILSPLDRRIAEEPFQCFFGFFGKVDIEFWHHADLLS